MITLENFMTSSFEKKCDLVINSTQYLISRKLGEATVYLYQSENFFVEVYYSSKYKKVLMINAFDDSCGLDVYAESVSLADIGY
jgi:hypothetical protein